MKKKTSIEKMFLLKLIKCLNNNCQLGLTQENDC